MFCDTAATKFATEVIRVTVVVIAANEAMSSGDVIKADVQSAIGAVFMENECTVGTDTIALAACGTTVCATISASRAVEFEAFERDIVEFEMDVGFEMGATIKSVHEMAARTN